MTNRGLRVQLNKAKLKIADLEKNSARQLKKGYVTSLRNNFCRLSPENGWTSLVSVNETSPTPTLANDSEKGAILPPEEFCDATTHAASGSVAPEEILCTPDNSVVSSACSPSETDILVSGESGEKVDRGKKLQVGRLRIRIVSF